MSSKLQYFVFEAKDGAAQRQQRFQLLRKKIIEQQRQQAMPIIRYEMGRDLVYFAAIALDTDAFADLIEAEDAAVNVVRSCYGRAPSTKYLVPDLQGLGKILRGAVGGKGYTNSLKFERDESGTHRAEALADAAEAGQIIDEAETQQDRSAAHNRLLYWCTANGSGDLLKFVAAAQLLGASPEERSPWSLVRRMMLLGHLQFARTTSGWRWSTAPRVVLKPLVNGLPFIAGQRLVGDGRGDGIEPTCQSDGPDRLAHASWPAAHSADQIAQRLPSFDDWIASVPFWDVSDFHGYSIERMGDEGQTEHMVAPDPESSDVHRFTRDSDNHTVHAWFDAARQRWLAGDVMSLQFIHRTKSGRAIAALSSDDALLVPRSDRWPLPYERALVLASGLLPTIARDSEGRALLRYRGVPGEFVRVLSAKLNVKIGD